MQIRRMILIILFMSLAGCARATEVTEVSASPTAGPAMTDGPPDAPIESPTAPSEGHTPPTLVPEPTPWAFPTPFWDNTNLKWPYGYAEPAIPVEATFGGPVKVYVLLGSDWMPHRDSDLTDIFMLVLVNTENDTAEVVSVARDLYVLIPGFGWGRINQPWSLGGFETVKETVRFNFGLEVDGVIYGRIYAIEQFIDNGLGNIRVEVREPIVEVCGDLVINLLPGEVVMDGKYATCYARARMLTGDFSRMGRQQEILLAMEKRFFESALDDPIGLARSLYQSYVYSGIKTDVSLADIPALVDLAVDIDENVEFQKIAPPMVEHFDHPESGAWLLYMPTPLETYEFFIQLLAD